VTVFRLLVWRHVAGELPRTALTVGGVALGVAVYVAVATANVEIVRSFEQAVLGVAGRTTLQVFNATNALGGFDERIIEPLSHADGVLLATPVLDLTGIWRAEGSARGTGWPTAPAANPIGKGTSSPTRSSWAAGWPNATA